VLIQSKLILENETQDSTEVESIDVESNSENESDFENLNNGAKCSQQHVIIPFLERICSTENCEIDVLMPLLQKASSLESWTIDSLHPLLRRFASNESAAFEECLAYFRDGSDMVSISSHDETIKNKQLSTLFDSAPVINPFKSLQQSTACANTNYALVDKAPVGAVYPMDLQVPVVKTKSKKIVIKDAGKSSDSFKKVVSDDIVPHITSMIESKSDTVVNDSFPDNEFLIPPILLRDISWGPMNLADSTKDIARLPAFPSPHSSYRPLDDLLFP
jgi:hypothetical protein